ncbi:MAG TPA: CDGSH iron-sulfur domain-containing protein [Rhodospirillaceae bacterium]|nr:CDGSH iron-sulfur domain-containing protein [Rhodospirillaceae bacterium]
MTTPTIAQKAPVPVELEAGKTYYYCTCGLSDRQPFCNGSHKGTEFAPQAFTADQSKTAYLCACKHSKSQPFCDGSHKSL